MRGSSFVLKDSRDLSISLILIFILGIAVFLLSYIWDIDRVIKDFEVVTPREEINIEREIRSRGGLYTKPPLGKNYDEESSQGYIYSILSYHKSWNMHRVLDRLIQSNRVLYVVIGIMFSNYKFGINKYKNYKRQIINMSIFNIIGSIFSIIIGYILLSKIDGYKIVGRDLFKYIDNIYLNYNVWRPKFLYNLLSILFTMLVFFSYMTVGYLIGSLTERILLATFLYILVSPILYLYPISPIYFIRKLSKFVFVPTNMFLYRSGGSFIDFIYFLVFIVIYYLLSYVIVIRKR